MTDRPSGPDQALAAAVRAEAGAIVASLARLVGDFDVAEEAVQDAIVEALRSWRAKGIPDRPGAWLQVAARRNALDRLRRQQRHVKVLERLREDVGTEELDEADERVALVFACCHPALPADARLPLTLRAVLGLTTGQIARAFLVSEATMAQRIVRAKRKIVDKGIALTVPALADRETRLDDVLTVTYLVYNEGYVSSTGATDDRDLADDAIWLAGLLATAMPDEPETLGLLALLQLQHARRTARFDASGGLVLLRDQDRALWDRPAIDSADRLLERAAAGRRPGRFQLQAAIAACHASSPTWEATDWLQILTLYDLLLRHDASAVVRLNRGVALGKVRGAAVALEYVDDLAPDLARYHLFHATRADLLRTLGRADEAVEADRRALELTSNAAERNLLLSRLR
ncbi:MAG TPA: sigma-70 family RNA polymerase sigma factor [Nocardioidaceae bacterium]|nr:sigma-70 family RNA polymerase sigma factor [Nocardioidaceae bacterium]